MGEYYGLDLSRPAHSAQEAVQWVYMAYLAAVKEQDGAAMSLGNVSSFLDIFIEYDLAHGTIDESFAQELIDQFVIKLRMVRHLRMQSYNDIFAGDPTWVTEAIGGRFNDGPHEGDEDLVPLPANALQPRSFARTEPHDSLEPRAAAGIQGLLRQGFGRHQLAIQYENDDLMREVRHSDDYGIACCVSFQDIGRQIQFFGARTNLAKALLLAINEGRCENTGTLMVKGIPALSEGPLRFEEVMRNYKMVLKEISPCLQRGHEYHPLHARQVLLREGPDGIRRHRSPHQSRLRRGRSLDRPRLALGHQIRPRDAPPQRRGAHRSLRHRG